MIEKFKQFIKKHSSYVPLLIIIALWVILIPFVFFIEYKIPIDLNNEKDNLAITEMLKKQHGSVDVKNITLLQHTIYPEYIDSIAKLTQLSNDGDVIMLYTDNVVYDIVSEDSVVESWITIFEVEDNFLHQKVGKHLITFRKQ